MEANPFSYNLPKKLQVKMQKAFCLFVVGFLEQETIFFKISKDFLEFSLSLSLSKNFIFFS